MKLFFQKLIDLYRTNQKFHALVGYVEYGLVGFFVGYSGGIPATKDAWKALIVGLIGAGVAAIKKWLINNVPAPPAK